MIRVQSAARALMCLRAFKRVAFCTDNNFPTRVIIIIGNVLD